MAAPRAIRLHVVLVAVLAASVRAVAQPVTPGLVFDGPASLLATVVEDAVPADLDGDGRADLAVFAVPYALRVLHGVGDGTFTLLGEHPVADLPRTGVVADLNGDGVPDACVAHESGLAALLGTGGGDFAPAVETPLAVQPYGVAAGDVDGDGWSDLAVSDVFATPPSVHVFVSQGDGQFVLVASLVVPKLAGSVLLQDLDGDGLLDLIAINAYPTQAVLVAPGLGAGSFGPFVSHVIGTFPGSAIAVDMDVDGVVDVVLSDSSGTDVNPGVWVAHGAGDGTFAAINGFTAGVQPFGVTSADIQSDGLPDVAALNWSACRATVMTGTGGGALGLPLAVPMPCWPRRLALTDFTADGVPDLSLVDDHHASVRTGLGDGTFVVPFGVPLSSTPDIEHVSLRDMDGDGHLDAVAGDYAGLVWVARGDGLGALGAATSYATGFEAAGMATGDVDLDGLGDAVTTSLEAGQAWLLPGQPGGALGPASVWPTGSGPMDIEIADLTGDGLPDLITANHYGNNASLLRQAPGGAFTSSTLAAGMHPTEVAVGDIDLDGLLDAGVLNRNSNDVTILLGHPRGGLVPGGSVKHTYPRNDLLIADADGDGLPDLVVAGDGILAILTGHGDGTFGEPATVDQGIWSGGALAVASGDVNDDGRLDLVTANDDSTSTLVEGREPGSDSIETRDFALQWWCSDVALGDLDEDRADDALVGTTHLTYAPWGTPDPQVLFVLLSHAKP